MSNSAEQLMIRAALLIEESDDVEGAEAALRDAIALSEISGRVVELTRAKAFLGELLAGTGRAEEAADEFRDVIELAAGHTDTAETEPETRIAREFLARAPGLE
jgi:predicted RNA polymerase sigma factor